MRYCLPTILGADRRTRTFVCFLTYLTKQVVIYLIVLVTGILICTSLEHQKGATCFLSIFLLGPIVCHQKLMNDSRLGSCGSAAEIGTNKITWFPFLMFWCWSEARSTKWRNVEKNRSHCTAALFRSSFYIFAFLSQCNVLSRKHFDHSLLISK